MIHGLNEHLIRHWDALFAGRWSRPRTIHWLKFGQVGDFPRPYAYFYLFLDRAREPAFVAKITAEREARARLAREFDLTRRLRIRVGPEIAATIPAPLAEVPFGAYWVGLEEFAGGERVVPVVVLDRPREAVRIERYVREVVDWIISFGRVGQALLPFDGDLYAHAVTVPLARFASQHKLAGEDSALLDHIVAGVAAHRGRTVPAVAMHGDLWPGNIFRAHGRLRVIDWGGYCEHDASYHDIYTFLCSFTVEGRQRVPAASLLATLGGESWFSALVRAELGRYARAFALDPALFALMLPLHLVRMAARREPVTAAAKAMNARFAGLLGAYLGALRAGEVPDVRRPPAPGPGPAPSPRGGSLSRAEP